MSGQKKFFFVKSMLWYSNNPKSLYTGFWERFQKIQISIQIRPIHKLGGYNKNANVRILLPLKCSDFLANLQEKCYTIGKMPKGWKRKE